MSCGLSKCSPAAARGPWSAVMSASKVSATVLPWVRDPFLKTGVRPPGPGARVGGAEGTVVVAEGAGRTGCGVAAQAVRAALRTHAAVIRRTRVIAV
jgi:hypothetical protein